MRKKIAIAVGLVVVTVTVVAILWMPPTEPQLRVGMSIDEVDKVLGKEEAEIDRLLHTVKFYHEGPDWLGDNRRLIVHFDADERLSKWKVEPQRRTRPPWLVRALKAAG